MIIKNIFKNRYGSLTIWNPVLNNDDDHQKVKWYLKQCAFHI